VRFLGASSVGSIPASAFDDDPLASRRWSRLLLREGSRYGRFRTASSSSFFSSFSSFSVSDGDDADALRFLFLFNAFSSIDVLSMVLEALLVCAPLITLEGTDTSRALFSFSLILSPSSTLANCFGTCPAWGEYLSAIGASPLGADSMDCSVTNERRDLTTLEYNDAMVVRIGMAVLYDIGASSHSPFELQFIRDAMLFTGPTINLCNHLSRYGW